MTHKYLTITLVIFSLLSGKGLAHDFWLEAHPFYTSIGETVDISLHVGNQFVGDSLPNVVRWYSDFSIYQDKERKDVDGELGRDPAGYFKAEQNGTYAIGYQSEFEQIVIDSATFNKYLHEEGLENAIRLRKEKNQTESPGRERYMRHAKSLVQSGRSFDVDFSAQKFNYILELIPQKNPYRLNPGDQLQLLLLYQDKPAEDIQIAAFSKINPQQVQRQRSNQDGIVTITLNEQGPWLVNAVKIISVDDSNIDWQSHWVSLTFSVAGNTN